MKHPLAARHLNGHSAQSTGRSERAPLEEEAMRAKKKATFYMVGCPVCISVEERVTRAIDASRYEIERVNLEQDRSRISEAQRAGVQSVPALVIDNLPFHINAATKLTEI